MGIYGFNLPICFHYTDVVTQISKYVSNKYWKLILVESMVKPRVGCSE